MSVSQRSTQLNTAGTPEPDYYHVYGKGVRGRQIFVEESDYIVFLALLKQYVRLQKLMDALEHPPILRESLVQLHSYCLTSTTFQLLLQQSYDQMAIDRFMHAVIVSYTSYFNHKYYCHSTLFNDVYKSTKVTAGPTLVALSQAMHAQPASWRQSSREMYIGHEQVDWLNAAPILRLAGGRQSYKQGLKRSCMGPVLRRYNRVKKHTSRLMMAKPS